MSRRLLLQILGIVGALGIAISGFLPWLRVEFLGTIEVTRGIDNYDGWVALVLGVIGLSMMFFKPRLAVIPALFALALAAYEWVDFTKAYADMQDLEDKGVIATLGAGLFVLPIGAILLALAGLLIRDNPT